MGTTKTVSDRRQSTPNIQLTEILAKLEAIESFIHQSQVVAPPPPPKKVEVVQPTPIESMSADQQVLLVKLDQLTLKRHAVLTATLGDRGYDQIAEDMKCSSTTIKLHLKSAMDVLGIPNRSALLATHKSLLSKIPDQLYKSRYNISKTWWMEQSAEHDALMKVLTHTKPVNNQHKLTEDES